MWCRCSCLLGRGYGLYQGLKSVPVATYKSQYSIDKLYPNSNVNFASVPPNKHAGGNTDNFTGYIPVDELDIRYSRSGGPGGQHINKVNTKVDIRFHVSSASWLPQWIQENLLQKEKTKITKDGYLIVTSEKTRKQILNQADCLDKLRAIIWEAAKKPYEPTKDEVHLAKERKEAARRGMLREKKTHSLKKASRQKPSISSI